MGVLVSTYILFPGKIINLFFCMLGATSAQFLNIPQLRKGKYPMPSPLILPVGKLISIDNLKRIESFHVLGFFSLLKEGA